MPKIGCSVLSQDEDPQGKGAGEQRGDDGDGQAARGGHAVGALARQDAAGVHRQADAPRRRHNRRDREAARRGGDDRVAFAQRAVLLCLALCFQQLTTCGVWTDADALGAPPDQDEADAAAADSARDRTRRLRSAGQRGRGAGEHRQGEGGSDAGAASPGQDRASAPARAARTARGRQDRQEARR
eukprot:2131344-Rhodomonas_salina.2